LQFLAREIASSRILALAAYRDVDAAPDLSSAPLSPSSPVSHSPCCLALSGLSEPELAELVSLTATQIASPALVAALHDEADGNPPFAREIVRLLPSDGRQSVAAEEIRLASH
jgi:hypothetical protein